VNDISYSLLPSALETSLLRAALLDGELAVTAYRDWRAVVDIDGLDGGSQRMLPLLASNLNRLGVRDDLTPALHGHRRHSLAANAHTIAGSRDALRALVDAGIEPLVLKGAALVASGLCELGLRPIGDVDALVRPGERDRAIEALIAAGWKAHVFPNWYVRRTLAREYPAWVWQRGDVQLDLHWGALHLVRDPVAEIPLWERATAADIGGVPVKVPAAEDQALHAWLHASEYNPIPPLRWAADAATAIQARGDDFDWDLVVGTAIAQRVVLQTRAALDYLARELDQPVPDAVLTRLTAERTSRLEVREHAARCRPPESRGRIDRIAVELQDLRRQRLELLARPTLTGALELRRSRRRGPGRDDRLHDLRDGPLTLNCHDDPLDSLLRGWSFPEPLGRWTVGRDAALAVKVEPNKPAVLVADLAAFVGLADRRQRVTVRVNGRREQVLRFDAADLDLKPREVRIEAPPSPDGTVAVEFRIASPCSPTSLGLPADGRELGLLLRSLQLASTG
jgi:putative nucleotidyltransferase-like protein